MKKKIKNQKKEIKQVVEIHIYIHKDNFNGVGGNGTTTLPPYKIGDFPPTVLC